METSLPNPSWGSKPLRPPRRTLAWPRRRPRPQTSVGAVVKSQGCPPASAFSGTLRACPPGTGCGAGRLDPPGSAFPPWASACFSSLRARPTPPDRIPQPPAPGPEQEWPFRAAGPAGHTAQIRTLEGVHRAFEGFPPGLIPCPRPCLPIPLRSLTLSQARRPATLEEDAPGGAALPRGGEAGRKPHVPPLAGEVTRMTSPACVTGSWTRVGSIFKRGFCTLGCIRV